MDIIIKKQELENISSLLPTIIYNELLKFTEEPISIEGDVTSPTTESVVETKIDKSVLLIKIKLFKKALEKDKSNKVLKIKIKLFEKELTKYAKGGGVGDVYKLIDGENTWYLTYLDSTHFFLSNTKEYKGSPYHIGEFRSRPFYNEVLSWLNSNKGKMAKGGGVDYNENREMVLNDNKQIAHHTKELQSAVKGKKVPAWVVAKVNRSATDISDSTHYMEGQGESYADGGSIKIGDKVMLPEIKMRDGKIQFEKVENGEVIEIQDGIYSVLNPKTNRIHQVSLNQIKFNNGGGVAIVGGEKVTEQQKDAIIKIINTYNESWYSVSKYSDGSVAISLVVKNNDPKHKEKYVEYIGAIGKDGNEKWRDMEMYLDDISEYKPKFTYAKGGSMASGGSLEEILAKKRAELNSYSDERIAKLFSDLMDIDYTDTLIELKGNAGERRDMIKELMDELTIRHNTRNKNKFEGGGVFNGKYLDTISSDKKNKILKNIANNYGFSIAEALAEVVDADAEMLYEYISNDQSLRMSVYNDIEGGKFAKGGGTSKIWIVNIAMPTSNNNMPKLIKKEIELGRMSNEFDVKQAILRKGRDWLGNGKVLTVYEKK